MLIQAVVGGVILIQRRQSSEVSPPNWIKLWRDWELRVLILLSLTTQLVLIAFGNRRKYIAGTWIQITVWSSYVLADSVAIMAVGVLSNDIGEAYRGCSTGNSLGPDYGLTAFWAPFLLLHLGGIDTVTAYSLEDNELWKRHSFAVVAQAGTTLYVLSMSVSMPCSEGGSYRLSPLFLVVFFVGMVKYCERVWALFSASEQRFRDSIPEIPTRESKTMEECKLKELEGYHLTTHQVLEVEVPDASQYNDVVDANALITAHCFLEMVKRLFADLILGFQDRDASRAIFESDQTNAERAAKIIEIELGFMYDLMYTKASVVYSSWGIARRIIGFFLILGVLLAMVVSLDEKVVLGQKYSETDLIITLVLLVVALLLDLFAMAEVLLSDQTAHWLIKHKKTSILQAINRIRTMLPTNWGRRGRKRWSKSVEQFSLLNFCFASREKPLFGHRVLKMLGINEILEIYVYKSITPPASLYHNRKEDLPNQIFGEVKDARHWAEKNGYGTDLKSLYGRKGGKALEVHNRLDLEWSVKLEFDQSILVWHLATEICYQLDYESEPDPERTTTYLHDRGKCLSRYMLYLLVEYPNMLPIGMGQIRFWDLYSGLGDFIEENMSKPLKDMTQKEASKMLEEEVNTDNAMLVGGGDRSNFVIFHGCKLASELKKYEQMYKWDIIVHVWLEMLGHAASQCRGRYHAQQLRRGGEYLTHVWLLMAHFGLTDHFQIPRSRAIAEVVLR